jgi:hypothetical protein
VRDRIVLVVACCLTLPTAGPAFSQDVVYPGSTVQGDILRGQGQLLKGMAWYERNAARAAVGRFGTRD